MYRGGKDSTALYLLAIEHGRPFRACFADTGHEHQSTYDYVRMLAERTGSPEIEWIKADFSESIRKKREMLPGKWARQGISEDIIAEAVEALVPSGNQFVDACLAHGGFPGTRARFCTAALKIDPMEAQVYGPLASSGRTVVVWLGVRREESISRRDLPTRQVITNNGIRYRLFRPILDWTLDDVLERHGKHGIKANPLYAEGFTRVGCFPCIYATKSEIGLIARNHPEAIDKLERWETLLNRASKSKSATFFNVNRDPQFAGLQPGETYSDYGIRHTVDWALTAHGGKQYDLLEAQTKEQRKFGEACNETGVCE